MVFNRPNFPSGAPKPFARGDRIHRARSPARTSNLRKPGSEHQARDQSAKQEQLRRGRRRDGPFRRDSSDLPDSEDCRLATVPQSFWTIQQAGESIKSNIYFAAELADCLRPSHFAVPAGQVQKTAAKLLQAAFKARHLLLSPFQLLLGARFSMDRVRHESLL